MSGTADMGMSDPTQPQDQSFGDKLANAASNPLVQMLLGLSKGFGQAAMPTPYRMPFGAVIGSAAGGAAQGLSDAYSMKLAQARAQQAQMQLPLMQAQTQAMTNIYRDPNMLRQLMTPGGMSGGMPYGNAPMASSSTAQLSTDSGSLPEIPRNSKLGTPGQQGNNPGNLMWSPGSSFSGAIGKIPVENGRYVLAFPDVPTGISAMSRNLSGYAAKGVNTINDAVTRWVGDPKADTTSYANDIAKMAGVAPDQRVDLTNPSIQKAFFIAQMPHESASPGQENWLNPADVDRGIALAHVGSAGQGVSTNSQGDSGSIGPQDALAGFRYHSAEANRIALAQQLHLPVMGDPNLERSIAQEYLKVAMAGSQAAAGKAAELQFAGPIAAAQAAGKAGVEMQTSGPIAGSIAAAKAPFENTRVPAGGIIYDGNGNVKGFAPLQSKEVIMDGPNKGMTVTVLRNPINNQIIGQSQPGQNVGAIPGTVSSQQSGLPPGSIPSEISPQQTQRLKTQGEVEGQDISHDRKVVEEDLGHVIENVIPAKQQLFQLRDLNAAANPGAAGQMRAQFKNWVQTFAPDFVSNVTGDASPAQEFNKIALMGAGKQERGDLGARGGFRAMELYLHANPSIDNQLTANHDMANALLVSHQMHEDYAQGASAFYNMNRAKFLQPGSDNAYTPLSQYDSAFVDKMRPQLYASAISALNGKPSSQWANGLSPDQVKIVGGILQRVDPNASVDLNGHQTPVSKFTAIKGPLDIVPGGFGGGGG